jgi:hypothetical protein
MLWLLLLLEISNAQTPKNAPVPKKEPFYYCPVSDQAAQKQKKNFNTAISFKANCNPINIENFCKQAEQQCLNVTGDDGCFWALPTENSCPNKIMVTEDQLIKMKNDNFTFIESRFFEIAESPEFQTQCCGTNEICKKGFASTELRLLKDLGRGELIGRAVYATAEMQISIARIGACQNAECLEGLLFHEFGHICHIWQYQTSEKYEAPKFIRPLDEVESDMAKYIGEKGSECVTKNLEAAYKIADRKIKSSRTIDDWSEEVYADALFMKHWGGGRIAYMCGSRQDAEHAQGKVFMGCMIEQPDFKRKFCAADTMTSASPPITPAGSIGEH